MTTKDKTTGKSLCPVCTSSNLSSFLEIADVPFHCNILWPTRNRALNAPRGNIRLAFCTNCSHIFNLAFNRKAFKYSDHYENSLHFSPYFQRYALSQASRLVDQYHLYDKEIIEIGCGQGEFLALLCKLGNNRGVGFDPSHTSDRSRTTNERNITFIHDFYSEHYVSYKADFFCCRHVFEHLYDPSGFLTMLRRAIGKQLNTVVFFEVPNVLYTLREVAVWDIIHEHYSYFSPKSLEWTFVACGFEILEITQRFAGQFLCIEAVPRKAPGNPTLEIGDSSEEMRRLVATFAAKYASAIKTGQAQLEQIRQAGQRAVVWGAGSKGVSFLNALRGGEEIEYVVDINPRKQGSYVAGTGQKIVPPEYLRDYCPDVVIVMNPLYESEIRQSTKDMGVSAALICM